MTLTQGRHQIWYELVDPMQCYTESEKLHLNSVREKTIMSIITLEYVLKVKNWYIHDLLDVLNNPMKVQCNWIRTQNFQ